MAQYGVQPFNYDNVTPQAGGFTYGMTGQYSPPPFAGNLNAAMYQQQFNAANQRNQQRYNDIGGFGDVGVPQGKDAHGNPVVYVNGQWVNPTPQNAPQMYQQIGANSLIAPMMGGYYGQYANMENQENQLGQLGQLYQNQYQGLANAYGQRTQTGMNLATAPFLQARNNVNSQFNDLQGQAMNELTQRGMTNSDVLSQEQASIEGQRGTALGNIADQMSQAQSGAYNQLSGQQLGAESDLSNQYLGFLNNYGQQRIQNENQGYNNMLQFAERRNDPYPDPNTFMQGQIANNQAAASQQQYQLQANYLNFLMGQSRYNAGLQGIF